MTHRLTTLTLTLLALASGALAQAQGLRLPSSPALPGLSAPAAVAVPVTQADFIVAVVNSEPVTNNEVQRETQRQLQLLAQQRVAPPDPRLLAAEVLEGLINRKAQLQLAQETGLSADTAAIDQAEQSIALQNQFDVAELHRRVERDGQSVRQFRAQLADQILLQRLREREVDARVRITEQDIDAFLRDQPAAANLSDAEINLAQILVAVPENATAQQVATLQQRAEQALSRARRGDDFAALVQELSDARDQSPTGQLGLRSLSRYPALFVNATQTLAVGEVAELVRSPAGFHILKVVEKVAPSAPTLAITQHHARHILLVPGARLSEAEARQRLADYRQLVLSKKADFAALAREHSQDGSAANGGDLGWAGPGMFVPEFEATLNRLAPGEVSAPLQSRFGLHLIQLLERRKVNLTQQQQREVVREQLREKKRDEVYRTWAQEVRARAYVELREPPLPL